MTEAAASATPSTRPTAAIEAPSVATMNTGSRLWISSEEASMHSGAKPMAQTPAGSVRHAGRGGPGGWGPGGLPSAWIAWVETF